MQRGLSDNVFGGYYGYGFSPEGHGAIRKVVREDGQGERSDAFLLFRSDPGYHLFTVPPICSMMSWYFS